MKREGCRVCIVEGHLLRLLPGQHVPEHTLCVACEAWSVTEYDKSALAHGRSLPQSGKCKM